MCCWPADEDNEDGRTETSPLISPLDLPAHSYQSIAADEFRILVLHPARNFHDDIVVHLQTRKRSDDRFYEAVSYCWGQDDSTDVVLVQDEASNVATLLRYLRYKWFPRYLWLDALCINQQDVEEKGFQVSQMGDIYRKSGRTLIWLGSSRICSRPLSALEAAVRARKAARWRDIDSSNSDFRDILELPWFRRRWVVQEVALS
ncbi:HET-domain-containing protein, partial [Setomelanomma holmii]